VSEFNELDGGRFFDLESQSSFVFDHISQVYAVLALGKLANAGGIESIKRAELRLQVAKFRLNVTSTTPSVSRLLTATANPSSNPSALTYLNTTPRIRPTACTPPPQTRR
jgi:hypothetical protein